MKKDSNVLGAASYVLLALSGVFMLVFREDDDFVRFHSIQSIVLSVFFFVAWVVLRFLEFAVSFAPFAQVLILFLSFVFTLALLLVWLYLMYQALEGKKYTLPYLEGFMKKYAK
jgi:uncharacterized membrane protein